MTHRRMTAANLNLFPAYSAREEAAKQSLGAAMKAITDRVGLDGWDMVEALLDASHELRLAVDEAVIVQNRRRKQTSVDGTGGPN